MATLSDFYYGDPYAFNPLGQYYLGSGVGATRFNQNYMPTTRFVSRGKGPESLYLNNMGTYVPTQMGDFTPSAGLMDMGMQSASIQPQVQSQRAPVDVVDMMAQDNPDYRAGAASEVAPQGAAPKRTLGLLGDMFGAPSALDEYMTPEQRAQLQNQGVLSAAMQLLAASGPSRTPIGLGQALGQAYGAGQQGYQAAQQNLMQSISMKQKMDEYKRARTIEALISKALTGETAAPGAAAAPQQVAQTSVTGLQEPPQEVPAGVAAQPMSAIDIQHDRYMRASTIAAQVGDTAKAKAYADLAKQIRPIDEVIGEPFRGNDGLMYSRLKSGGTIPFKGVSPMDKPVGEPFRGADGNVYQRTESGGVKLFAGGTVKPAAKPSGQPQQQLVDGKAQMVQYFDDGTYKVVSGIGQVAKPQGEPRMQMIGGAPKMVQYYDDGTRKILEGVSQFNPPSTSITDVEFLTGKPLAGSGAAGIAKVQDYRKSGATSVSINTGEKGFKYEFDLKKEFTNEPVYKEFQSMNSAFKQVQESLKKENPIGDVAAATKIMKLLDPGSVVRESELGIAMAASGKMDRLTNYVDMWKKGTLLTPSQRTDFGSLANELYNAAANSYNAKRGEYAAFGNKYEIDATTALGGTAPVFTFAPPAGAAGGAGRPPLSSIIRPRGAP